MNNLPSKPFSIDSNQHLLTDALYMPSPNCDDRPQDALLSLIVIHNISLPPNEFGGDEVMRLFTNTLDYTQHPFYQAHLTELKVSSHLFIRRTGEIIQFVPFHRRAWHAGVSNYQGQQQCNDFSVGIELEGADNIAYTPVQYLHLINVVQCLIRCYPSLSYEHITGHQHIAPGRKTDPGPAFDWDYFRLGLKEEPCASSR
jgi:AmpD protein